VNLLYEKRAHIMTMYYSAQSLLSSSQIEFYNPNENVEDRNPPWDDRILTSLTYLRRELDVDRSLVVGGEKKDRENVLQVVN